MKTMFQNEVNNADFINLSSLTEGTIINTNTSFLQSECSHKVIEKRRRDRINTSLGELSQLLPAQSNGKQVLLCNINGTRCHVLESLNKCQSLKI